ncbi:hypothetical protein CDQ68_07090 [Campylobacter hyointestinalis subsp. hyointestinalis]|nr:hypothetical protein CDQ68_07090 [Campylobacter hyointestinalis subsp. hyointestinalis]
MLLYTQILIKLTTAIACFKAHEITNSVFSLNLADLIFILLVAMIVFISYKLSKISQIKIYLCQNGI